jgi:hypothetical protein
MEQWRTELHRLLAENKQLREQISMWALNHSLGFNSEKAIVKERDEALAEVKRLKRELHDTIESYKLNNLQPKTTRPDPSRLEIAAIIAAAWESNSEIRKYRVETGDDLWPIADALLEADALIAAAREAK